MSTNHDRARWIVEKAKSETDYLSEWETNFLYDIWERLERAERIGREYSLTDKQMEVLERIGEKV